MKKYIIIDLNNKVKQNAFKNIMKKALNDNVMYLKKLNDNIIYI